jgi:hypothetical protein
VSQKQQGGSNRLQPSTGGTRRPAGLGRAVTKGGVVTRQKPLRTLKALENRGNVMSPFPCPLAEIVSADQRRGRACWSVLNNKKR